MNPLAVTAAGALNFAAMYLIVKFLLLNAIAFMPAGPARDGFTALAL